MERIQFGNLDFFELENEATARIKKQGFDVDYITCCNSENLDFAANDDKRITVLGAMYTKKARLMVTTSVLIIIRSKFHELMLTRSRPSSF